MSLSTEMCRRVAPCPSALSKKSKLKRRGQSPENHRTVGGKHRSEEWRNSGRIFMSVHQLGCIPRTYDSV